MPSLATHLKFLAAALFLTMSWQQGHAAECVTRCTGNSCTSECPSETPTVPSSRPPLGGIPSSVISNRCITPVGACTINNAGRIPSGTACGCQTASGVTQGQIQ
jgi:hypothetical protein